MVQHPLCKRLQITKREVRTLLGYLRLGADDWKNLQRVHEFIDTDLDALVADVYDHILGIDQLQHLLSGPGILDRLRSRMRTYLATLGRNATSLDYFEERLRVGFVHEGIGLGLRWYLGIYPFLTAWIANRLVAHVPPGSDQFGELISSLHKVVSLDTLLAVETYHHASNQRLEDVLSEQYLTEHDLRHTTALDGLTGIMNRQSVMESLEVEFLKSQRFRNPFALVLIDVDAFKKINDDHGHRFGDFVLKRIVELIRTVLRPADLIGRYGGDEIVVGLPGCAESDAFNIAERIRLKVALARFEKGRACAPVTLSIGLTPLVPSTRSPAELLERADRALYHSKNAGRNRTSSWSRVAAGRPESIGIQTAYPPAEH